jgi:potassium voltage-gated channel Shal-related subfamily D protein 2
MASTSPIELNRLRRPPPLQNPAYFTEEHSPPVSPSNFVAQNAEEEDALNIQPPWKRSLYQLLEQPTSSPAAFVFHMFSTFLIILSAIITVLETVPAVHSISIRTWFGLETSIVALFTMEYAARCVAWSNTWSSLLYWTFCKSPNDLGFNAD